MVRTRIVALLLAVDAAAASGSVYEHAVVVAEHRLAAEAGAEVLRQGGNAVDAAVATALAVCVVNPTSCGIGGGGFMVIFQRKTGRVDALDYREMAPAAASRDLFVRDGKAVPDLSRYGGLAVAVPGEVAGLSAALHRYGTLSLATLASAAVALARDGFPIEAHLADSIAQNQERIRARPALAALLLHEDGTPLRVGEVLRQPALAHTLETVASAGPDGFYDGAIADAIVDAVHEAGGVMRRADLHAYRSRWRQPLRGRLRGDDVYSMPPPSSGGGVLIETLNILAGDDLAALGHNSPTYVHLLAEAFQFSFAARAAEYGDPDFVRVPTARLLTPEAAAAMRQRISAVTTFAPDYYSDAAGAGDDAGTSHLSVIDAAGNAVACTTSINTAFGSMVVAGATGIILNNTMDDFSAQPGAPNAFGLVGTEANAVAPHKRPLSSMTPTVIVHRGLPVAVAGGSGGPLIISATTQVILNTLVLGMDAEAAVAAPRLHHQWKPPVLLLEPDLGSVTPSLQRMGYTTKAIGGIAAVQLARRTADGTLDGAADPRKGGAAAGW